MLLRMRTRAALVGRRVLEAGRVPRAATLTRRHMSMRITGASAEQVGEDILEVTLATNQGDFKARTLEHNVGQAVSVINERVPQWVSGLDPSDQQGIDTLVARMDGTEDFSEVTPGGALGISMATFRAGAVAMEVNEPFQYFAQIIQAEEVQMPMPIFHQCTSQVAVIPSGVGSLQEAIDLGNRLREATKGVVFDAKLRAQLPELRKVLQEHKLEDLVSYGFHSPKAEMFRLLELGADNPVTYMYDLLSDEEDDRYCMEQITIVSQGLQDSCQVVGGPRHSARPEDLIETLRFTHLGGHSLDLSRVANVSTLLDMVNIIKEGDAGLFYASQTSKAQVDHDFIADLCVGLPVMAVTIFDNMNPVMDRVAAIERQLQGKVND